MRRSRQRQEAPRNRRNPPALLALLLVACLARIRPDEAFQLAPGTVFRLNDVPVKPASCEDVYQDCDERISALESSSPRCAGQTELLQNCRRTCGSCEPPLGPPGQREAPECEDEASECQEWATSGECSEVSDQCKKSCGLCEGGDEELAGFQGGPGHNRKAITKRKKKALAQRHDLVPGSKCHDRFVSCEALAAVKWCIHDPLSMQAMCPESCYMCTAASSEVLQRVSTLEQVFSGDAIKTLQGTDWDRFIPGIDPVFKESQADVSEIAVESLDVMGTWLMRRYQPNGSGGAQKRTTDFLVKDIEEDVEQLERAPGREGLCIDWHPTCVALMQSGECIERPYEMGVICQESCGLCKPPEDEWEMPVLDPEVRGRFGGAREGQTEDIFLPGSREPDGDHLQPPPLERAMVLPWAEDEQDAGEGPEEASSPRSSGGHLRGKNRKGAKKSPADGPIAPRDLGDHRKLFPTIGISLNGLGNSTGGIVQAAVGAGVTRFEALLLAPGDPDAARLDLFRDALNSSGVPRSAVYLGLALHPNGYGSVIRQLLESLKELRTGYADMALLTLGPELTHKLSLHSWKGLEHLHGLNIVRALGGAGLGMSAYTFLARRSSVKFRVFQKALDPFYPDRKGVDFSIQKGFTYVGTRILGDPSSKDGSVSDDPTLVALASNLGQSVATVVARWALQRGIALTLAPQDLPTPIEALREAMSSFRLQDQEMAVVDKLVRADPPPPAPRKVGGPAGGHKAAKGGSSGGNKAGAQKLASGPGDREGGKGPPSGSQQRVQ